MKRSILPFVLSFLAALPLSAASLTVGTYTQTSCFPFGCGPNEALTSYQQLYSASNFTAAGPVDITSLSFFSAANPGGPMGQATYDVYLSSTSVADLAPPMAGNLGADRTLFAHLAFSQYDGHSQIYDSVNDMYFAARCGGNQTAVIAQYSTICDQQPQKLTITGNSASHFDPTAGKNLLMDIVISAPYPGANFHSWANLQAGPNDGMVIWNSNYWSVQGRTGFLASGALVTEFAYDSQAPEPATWASLLGGLVVAAAAARRRR